LKISLQWPLWRPLLSFVLYEAGWYACVKAAALGAMGWGIAAAAVSIAWELTISRRRGADLLLMAVAVGTGFLWDTLLVQTHLVTYASHEPFTATAPLWMLVLWAQLGSVLREPLRWLHRRLWLAAALGAVGGAASYAAGVRIGAVAFSNYPLALAVIAAGWSAMTPMLFALASSVREPRS
jgi:hypothetical protein